MNNKSEDLQRRMRIGGLQTARERYERACANDQRELSEDSWRAVQKARETYKALRQSYEEDYPDTTFL